MFSFLMFAVPGFLLDRWLETEPVFLLVGVFLGLFGMFALLYKVAAELSHTDKKKQESKPASSEDASDSNPG